MVHLLEDMWLPRLTTRGSGPAQGCAQPVLQRPAERRGKQPEGQAPVTRLDKATVTLTSCGFSRLKPGDYSCTVGLLPGVDRLLPPPPLRRRSAAALDIEAAAP